MSILRLLSVAALVALVSGPVLAQDGQNRPTRREPVVTAPLPPAAPGEDSLETPDEATARLNATVKARIDAADARDRARDAAYAADVAAYEAQKRADAEAFAAAQAEYEAQKAAVEARRAADLAAWRACKAGDRSQCVAN
ncbi:MAG: hypothetical protein V4466_07485 [Pseudomonadota bacterium]